MFIFQDDNAKIHQVQIMKDWPAQSRDLNLTKCPKNIAHSSISDHL